MHTATQRSDAEKLSASPLTPSPLQRDDIDAEKVPVRNVRREETNEETCV